MRSILMRSIAIFGMPNHIWARMRSITIFGMPNHIWARMRSIDTEQPLQLIAADGY